MFKDLLDRRIGIAYVDKLIIKDFDGIFVKYKDRYKIKIYEYTDVEEFRYIFETVIKNSKDKFLVIIPKKMYIPYDIQKEFKIIDLTYDLIFPKLNSVVLREAKDLNLDLVEIAYDGLFENLNREKETRKFLDEIYFDVNNRSIYIKNMEDEIEQIILNESLYTKWFKIAEKKAEIRNIQLMNNDFIDNKVIDKLVNDNFEKFILNDYKGLTGRNTLDGPIILSKVMDYILLKKDKFAIIVMDGMSVADWQVLSKGFSDIEYDMNYAFALIPTLTSISRQSLLSGKLPVQIDSLFNLSKEKEMFVNKCIEYNYKKEQIKYFRGYDVVTGIKDRCIAVIINDIDDLVHNQLQGYNGMYRDVRYISELNKLQNLIHKLQNDGYEIYITADHGNVAANGIGKVKKAGIEVETKSKRTVIYKDYADEQKTKAEFNLIEYPGYYMPSQYKYLICQNREALAGMGEEIMSHGGISIEEVIVPFIKIKGEKHE